MNRLKLFSTHPPTDERVARLRAFARQRLGLTAQSGPVARARRNI